MCLLWWLWLGQTPQWVGLENLEIYIFLVDFKGFLVILYLLLCMSIMVSIEAYAITGRIFSCPLGCFSYRMSYTYSLKSPLRLTMIKSFTNTIYLLLLIITYYYLLDLTHFPRMTLFTSEERKKVCCPVFIKLFKEQYVFVVKAIKQMGLTLWKNVSTCFNKRKMSEGFDLIRTIMTGFDLGYLSIQYLKT